MGIKLVFLDFDGVICPGSYDRPESTNITIGSPEWYAIPMDKDCIERLNNLINATGAYVVISSAWRLGHRLDELRNMLEIAGFTGNVIGKTGVAYGDGSRGDQIAAWIEDGRELFDIEEVESFVILDDNDDMSSLLPFLVLTNFKVGLTEKDVTSAIKILNPFTTKNGIIIPS